MLNKAIDKIREQMGKAKDYNVQYLGAELIGILRHNPDKAEIVLQDMENPDMDISKCEKKIAEYFRQNRGKTEFEGPIKIISEFYGLNIDAQKTAELMYLNDPLLSPAALDKPTRINIDDFI